MLKDVLNNELNTLTIDAVECIDLDESMAAGVGLVPVLALVLQYYNNNNKQYTYFIYVYCLLLYGNMINERKCTNENAIRKRENINVADLPALCNAVGNYSGAGLYKW